MSWSDDDGDDDARDKGNFNSLYCLSDYHTVYISMYSSVPGERTATIFREKLLSSFLISFILCLVHVVVCIHLYTHVTKLYEGWNFNSGNYLFTTHTK